jgi:hypothetical protein
LGYFVQARQDVSAGMKYTVGKGAQCCHGLLANGFRECLTGRQHGVKQAQGKPAALGNQCNEQGHSLLHAIIHNIASQDARIARVLVRGNGHQVGLQPQAHNTAQSILG